MYDLNGDLSVYNLPDTWPVCNDLREVFRLAGFICRDWAARHELTMTGNYLYHYLPFFILPDALEFQSKLLGEGHFGSVYEVRLKDVPVVAALKVAKAEARDLDVKINPYHSLMVEIAFSLALSIMPKKGFWPFARILGIAQCSQTTPPQLGLLTERYDDLVEDPDDWLETLTTDSDRMRFFKLLADAVLVLHSLGVIHSDLIEGRNVLLRRRDKTPLILDFGLSLYQSINMDRPLVSFAGNRGKSSERRSDLSGLGSICFKLFFISNRSFYDNFSALERDLSGCDRGLKTPDAVVKMRKFLDIEQTALSIWFDVNKPHLTNLEVRLERDVPYFMVQSQFDLR